MLPRMNRIHPQIDRLVVRENSPIEFRLFDDGHYYESVSVHYDHRGHYDGDGGDVYGWSLVEL